jgi:hypothetical protein
MRAGTWRTVRRPLLRGTAVVAALALGASGCGLFEPVDPEAPSGSSGVVVQDYSTPDNTLATLGRGIHGKNSLGAAAAYIEGFADPAVHARGFEAEFDPITQSRNPGRFPLTWGNAEERTFFGLFIQVSTNPYGLVWERDDGSPNDEIDEASGTALLHRRYTVWDSTTATSARRIAVGFADLEFIRTPSPTAWVIVKWTDREDAAADFGLGERSYGERRLNSTSVSP